jgi:signal transduction histidine kinase
MNRSRAWLGSLYWRIALACLGLLAAGLLIQMIVVIATLSRPSGLRARVTAQQLARTVAIDLRETLEFDPATSVRTVLSRHQDPSLPVFFVTVEGQVTGVDPEIPDPVARGVAALAAEYAGGLERSDLPVGIAAVEVLGQPEGHVVVPPRRPGWAVLRELGPWPLGGAALSVIVIAALLAWLAFAPAHRRLQALEGAATRLGRGDLTARAPEDGADEISRVSRAFNQTADALAAQIQRVTSEQEVRRQLLADVSHELHTPLTAIRGYIETLRMPDLPLDDAARARYLAIVDDEAVRLEHLIGDLLDLAKMEAGGQALRVELVPIESLWTRLRDRYGPAATAAGVRLVFDEPVLAVHADAGRLEQAISNLVGNAIRFTPAGGEVSISAQALPAGGVRIVVKDSGVGLSAEAQARVFDRFYKLDASRSRAGAGTGLGLTIVRVIAEAHGGTATVSSTPGQGSTFSVTIPQKKRLDPGRRAEA